MPRFLRCWCRCAESIHASKETRHHTTLFNSRAVANCRSRPEMSDGVVKRSLSEPRGATTLLAGFRLNDPNDGAVVANLDRTSRVPVRWCLGGSRRVAPSTLSGSGSDSRFNPLYRSGRCRVCRQPVKDSLRCRTQAGGTTLCAGSGVLHRGGACCPSTGDGLISPTGRSCRVGARHRPSEASNPPVLRFWG